MTTPTPEQLQRLIVMAEDNDPEIILCNLSEFALDGNSAHPEAVLMAEAAIILSAALRELDQARQMLADAPHDTDNRCRFGWHKTLPDLSMGDALPCTCWKAGL